MSVLFYSNQFVLSTSPATIGTLHSRKNVNWFCCIFTRITFFGAGLTGLSGSDGVSAKQAWTGYSLCIYIYIFSSQASIKVQRSLWEDSRTVTGHRVLVLLHAIAFVRTHNSINCNPASKLVHASIAMVDFNCCIYNMYSKPPAQSQSIQFTCDLALLYTISK